jgi:nucleoside 2-deoxyribosyltransferase
MVAFGDHSFRAVFHLNHSPRRATMSTCFIILPMSTPVSVSTPDGKSYRYQKNHFDDVLKKICIPAVKRRRFQPISPSQQGKGAFPITPNILKQLQDADLVLCDISSLNPNVLFELGIRRALNKPFAIINDINTQAPFNLKDFNSLEYKAEDVHKSKKAKAKLIKTLAEHLPKAPIEQPAPTTVEPFAGAAACGITEVFLSRAEAEEDVVAAVKRASERLWILGIGLSQVFRLWENLRVIEKKIERAQDTGSSFDARILLLDALTTTGVFRTLLETSGPKIEQILNAPRYLGEESRDDPYFNEQLYRDFENAWTRFKGGSNIADIVRFYAHTPTCWLVMTDDTAYFQPYTFGAAPNSDEDSSAIGPLMPVFKFDGAKSARPFQILEDHFEKLWQTTNTDLFHVRARDPEAQDTLFKIFNSHGDWLRQVYAVLHKPGWDRRHYPRKRCNSKLQIYIRKHKNQTPRRVEKVVNFSQKGLALKLKDIELKSGNIVNLEVLTPRRPKGALKMEKAGEYVKTMLVDPCDGRFRVVRVRKGLEFLIVGLEPAKRRTSR